MQDLRTIYICGTVLQGCILKLTFLEAIIRIKFGLSLINKSNVCNLKAYQISLGVYT